jgi:hypothetical protein
MVVCVRILRHHEVLHGHVCSFSWKLSYLYIMYVKVTNIVVFCPQLNDTLVFIQEIFIHVLHSLVKFVISSYKPCPSYSNHMLADTLTPCDLVYKLEINTHVL